jgi:DNA-binding protein Fis
MINNKSQRGYNMANVVTKIELRIQKIEVVTATEALILFRGNQTEMANALGINRGTLRNKLAEEKLGSEFLIKVKKTYDGLDLEWINK